MGIKIDIEMQESNCVAVIKESKELIVADAVEIGFLEWCRGTRGYVTRIFKGKDGIDVMKPYIMIKVEQKEYDNLTGKMKQILHSNEPIISPVKMDNGTFLLFLYETHVSDPSLFDDDFEKILGEKKDG